MVFGIDGPKEQLSFIVIYIRPLDDPVWPKLLVGPDLKPYVPSILTCLENFGTRT